MSSIISPPPRYVPLSLKLSVIFGGFFSNFGWFFFGFGLIFFWIFTMNSDFSSIEFTKDNIKTINGKVNYFKKTHASVGGNKHSKGTPVYATYYNYCVNKKIYNGISYATGKYYEKNNTITVEYLKKYPKISRIKGMRRNVFGMIAGLITLIFPIIGLIMIIISIKKGLKAVKLLEFGKLELAQLVSKTKTNTRINKKRVYKMKFKFTADNGRIYNVIEKTHLPEKLEDDELEKIFYYPYDPNYTVMFDSIPGNPEISIQGNFNAKSFSTLLKNIFIPSIVIIGHSIYFFYFLI